MAISLCFMAPIKYLQHFSLKGDMLFALPHIAEKSQVYSDFFRDYNGYKIIDSGVVELGNPYQFEDMLRLACDMAIQEIAIPDFLFDAKKTAEHARAIAKTCSGLSVVKNFNFMGIVQGATLNEWLECFSVLASLDIVSTIGISIYSVRKVFSTLTNKEDCMSNRLKCIEFLVKKNLMPQNKVVHLLGLGDPAELVYQKEVSFIRSCDTTRPIIYGLKAIRYTRNGLVPVEEYKGTKMDYYMNIDQACFSDILYNIDIVKECAQ